MPNVVKASSLRPNPNPIDPDVVVPAAVRRAAEAAAAAQEAAYPKGDPAPAPTPTPSNPDTVTIAQPAVTPPGNEPAPAPPPEPAPTPTPTPTPAPTPAPGEESWEHKFKSAEGRRLKAEGLVSQLTDRLGALENLIQDLQTRPAPAPAPAPAPSRLVTEQEENEFGSEMLDVMGRRAKEIVSPELADLRTQMATLESKLNGTTVAVQRNARQDMLSSLDGQLPDWRKINNLSEFKAWLALPDPYFGVIRHNALLSAFEQNDTSRVLNFFKGFVSELAVTDPASELPGSLTPPAPQPDKPGLEALAAPGRARTPAQSNVPAEKQIITTADINAFYAAKARGAYAGREAEFAQLEQELFRAQREGRVRAV